MRLNVPAGTAVRFEPGDEKRVTLVELAGARARCSGSTASPRAGGSASRRSAEAVAGVGSAPA